MVSRRLVTAVFCLASSPALADVAHLVDGGTLTGVVRVDGDEVAVVTTVGEIRVARRDVRRIDRAEGALDTYLVRRGKLDAADVEGHRALARWAAARDLGAQAAAEWRAVLASRPEDAEARRALGYVLYEGRWLTEADHQRALGRVRFGGVWMRPEQAEAARASLHRARAPARRPAPPPSAQTPAPEAPNAATWIYVGGANRPRFGARPSRRVGGPAATVAPPKAPPAPPAPPKPAPRVRVQLRR